jgi:hypothetical protein
MLDVDALTRPILGIENRTAQEAFDIMCDRFRRAALPSGAEPVDSAYGGRGGIGPSGGDASPHSSSQVTEEMVEAGAEALCLATGLDWSDLDESSSGDNSPAEPGPETKRYFRGWARAALVAALSPPVKGDGQ